MKNLFNTKQTINKDNLNMPNGIDKHNYLQMKIAEFNLSSKTIKKSLLVFSFGISIMLNAKENIGGGLGHRNNGGNQNNTVMLAGCSGGKTQQEISLNNVRTRILTDGDMWWDFTANAAKYEIPKGSNSYAMFAGSLWFGGYVNADLRLAAMTYRQTGYDFWPGPLNPSDLSTDVATCNAYDKVWQFNRTDVASFYAYWTQYHTADPATPTWIKDYPGNSLYPGAAVNIPANTVYNNNNATLAGATAALNYLAPYVDVNSDGTYNYASGDYPAYNISGTKVSRGHCVRYLFGDVTNFWVFNDNANIHTETKSINQIGVEVRGQGFEFSTNDELNDMTFYNYEIINWSTNTLTQTYFTVWADCDLGNYQDDYVGCDVSRGLGYQYNGDNYDEDVGGQTGYHDKLPAIGCDFFQGPYADLGDGIDNDRDGCVDCSWSICSNGTFACPPAILDNDPNGFPEQCIMSKFTYYNNSGDPLNGNPSGAKAYYNLMRGYWESGGNQQMSYGNLGLTAPAPGTSPACNFLFPGNSDPLGWGLGYHPNGTGASSTPGTAIAAPTSVPWTEASVSGDNPGDRRFMQSAGPFTLIPGAVNYVTFGLPFARSASNNNLDPIPLMEAADDKAQSLFDNCFKVLDGPDAPDLTIQELDQQFLITLTNNPYTSNNYEAKRYADVDPSITFPTGGVTGDKVYRFEGYKVYQLLDGTVSVSDLFNPNLARLIFQCDIKNGVSQLINYSLDPTLGTVPQLMVSGTDAGILNSFSIKQDQFAVSDKTMINFKNYYYMAVSYAYNNYLTYKPDVSPVGVATQTTVLSNGVPTNTYVVVSSNPVTGDSKGQKKPYLQGRNNVKQYTAIPHNPAPEAYGTVMNSAYGTGPQITRIEGQGNGGYALDLTDASVADILSSPVSRAQKITYVSGRAPLLVKVTDPLRVVKGDFTIKFIAASKLIAATGGVSWSYNGNAPIPSPALLDTGRVKNVDTLKWFMTGTYYDLSGNKVTKTWLSDEGLSVAQEKIVTGLNNEPLGFSITIKQCQDPQQTARQQASGPLYAGSTIASDLIESSISFAGSSWLSGVVDVDGTNNDWILAGSNTGTTAHGTADIFQAIPAPASSGRQNTIIPADPGAVWETVVGRTWAPFRMLNGSLPFPGYYSSDGVGQKIINQTQQICDTRLLSSVDVVFTNDPNKWTRCPVIDMNSATDTTTNLPYKWQLRRAKSVDKNGTTTRGGDNNDQDSSMGWFPGYAINIETGERLNIIFSENSADVANNGNDMKWNPTNTDLDANNNQVFGGKHFIYILGHNADGNITFSGSPAPNNVIPADVARYDAGLTAYKMLAGLPSWPRFNTSSASSNTTVKQNKWAVLAELFKDIMWTSMPLSSVDISDPHKIPGNATVKIRVTKPFRYGLSTTTSSANTSYTVGTTGSTAVFTAKQYSLTPLNSNAAVNLPSDVVTPSQNGNFPMYQFNTNDLVASTYQVGTAQAALAMINIVPNPYYAHDSYEQTRIDLKVKIINLPGKCTVKIYTLSGTLIRTLTKDNSDTYMVWDLHNTANIQISSGLYILHIDAPGIGERIIKWFGVMRPYDLQSY